MIKRKLSGGNDGFEGALRYAELLSVCEILKRQGRDVFKTLQLCFQGSPISVVPQ